MDFSKIAPTIDDFLEQVDAINFDQEVIPLKKFFEFQRTNQRPL